MKALIHSYLFAAFALLLPTWAVAVDLPTPEAPKIEAGGYLLLDFQSGNVLAQFNADERMEPASLTKIMTAYVVFNELSEGNLKLDDEVLVSEKAWRTSGSKMFIEVGKRIRVEDLIQGMIIQSGNDASVALAEHIAGSEMTFAELMNAQAKRLGMIHSHFTNAPGLPNPNHYSTPRDIAILATALIRDFPQYYRWYSQAEFTYNGIKQQNRNRLLSQDPSVDGVKTGFTDAAGYCLVSSAKRDGQRMIAVVMKTPNPTVRARDSLALLNYGFRFFETHVLFPAQKPLETLRIWKGSMKALPVGSATDVAVTIPRGRYDQLTTRLEKPAELFAPVAAGEAIGEIVIALGEQDIKRIPLVALQEVTLGGIWRRMIDTVLRWFQ
ncbi:D-alanyl-D-alanine carboxypeptidase [Rhodoferax sp. 4810]|uniref:serine-type D-Ala-D-Ala carboxypeptidase n=1 Tax=Thiospirillum jenense TaxID=1653858 RepID=A0A839H8D2_9GAMM|nr:D-alanyl-D-alanine carboxypeptidase family protein [Thiospirillum jenense]MBB1073343.1 D-alanyl-D-alanine carboxypeptidase [Rhodoferax jenense]MBB1125695.1 D-alanyl-D-alanine carboxypeptidase [Thiospirillum jenense]